MLQFRFSYLDLHSTYAKMCVRACVWTDEGAKNNTPVVELFNTVVSGHEVEWLMLSTSIAQPRGFVGSKTHLVCCEKNDESPGIDLYIDIEQPNNASRMSQSSYTITYAHDRITEWLSAYTRDGIASYIIVLCVARLDAVFI